ncbi:hypothetical protein [Thiohalomonas denitrificans]|uniref:Uncharacterized protein n=1 Tax=Thiohalomonas denitrificans TaxID=415747 RepID=A0A1G5QY09_9GAMM|nr:hypothetical protein [Thiohalomonas denitrificans]SCZ66652.1 hypothetical protein SAMN03097708_02987 [Thiohalomonas denitrificans]
MKLLLLMFVTAIALPGAQGSAWAGDEGIRADVGPANQTVPAVFVRVIRLLATGPDGEQRSLYEDPEGRVVPLMKMDKLGESVITEHLPTGAYYNLQAGLANELMVATVDGRLVTMPYTRDGSDPKLPLNGAVLVAKDGASVPGLVPQFVFDSQHAFGRPRNRDHDEDREHDDD